MSKSSAIERAAVALRKHGERQARFLSKEPQMAVVMRLDPLQVELTNANLVLDDEDLTVTQGIRKYERDHGLKVGDTVVVQPVASGEWVVSDIVSEKSTFEGADAEPDLNADEIGGGAVEGLSLSLSGLAGSVTVDGEAGTFGVSFTGGSVTINSPGSVDGHPIIGTVPYRNAAGQIIGRLPLLAP